MSDTEFFAAFDAYCAEHNITPDEAPMAFAAFLNHETGWDDEVKEITE